jgi:hypothetical protein
MPPRKDAKRKEAPVGAAADAAPTPLEPEQGKTANTAPAFSLGRYLRLVALITAGSLLWHYVNGRSRSDYVPIKVPDDGDGALLVDGVDEYRRGKVVEAFKVRTILSGVATVG